MDSGSSASLPRLFSYARFMASLVLIMIVGKVVCSQPLMEVTTSTADQADIESRERMLATVRLHEYIHNVSGVKEKVAPFVKSDSGEFEVTLNVTFLLASILSVDDAHQTLETVNYFEIKWWDKKFQWNASEFSGIQSIDLPRDTLWKPNLFVVNSVDPKNMLKLVDFLVVKQNGLVEAKLPLIVHTMCNMDHARFPYDTQQCSVVLNSLSSGVNVILQYQQMGDSQSSLTLKNEWLLKALEKVLIDPGEGRDELPALRLTLSRRTTFYTVCLVVPMVLTSYMNTLVFLLPLQSGEKVSFLVTIFVSTSVFVSFFKDVMPRGLHGVPATMKLLIGVIAQSLLVLIATLVVMRRYHQQHVTCDVNALNKASSWSGRKDSFNDSTIDNKSKNKTGLLGLSNPTTTIKVSPAPGNNVQEDPGCGKKDSKPRWGFCVTAQLMDRGFFWMAFVANTVFLLVIFLE